jgi:molybdopterin synthase catalytic subunit
MNLNIHIQREDFDVADEIEALGGGGVGAVASFIGLVRGDDGLTALTLEHYPGMTESEIGRIAEEATQRWPLDGITVIHRIGRLTPGDRIVLVAAAAAHRGAAFAACEFLMDFLKTRAPFWKEEERDGAATWVEHRASDGEAAARWRKP